VNPETLEQDNLNLIDQVKRLEAENEKFSEEIAFLSATLNGLAIGLELAPGFEQTVKLIHGILDRVGNTTDPK
jgi:uncharacterized metal-binding protein